MKANDRNSIVLSSLAEAKKEVEDIRAIPPGYITVQLSTKGKLGAPSIFHIRNFKMKEIVALAMSEPSELPLRLINALDDMIYEDVDAAQWHEKEVEELMVYLFMTFYRSVLDDLPFPLNADDLDIIKGRDKGDELLEAIKEGKYVPKTSIDIARDVDTYDLDEKFNPNITITNKKTGFHVTFSYIKYGDQLTIRRWLDSYFADEERRFAAIKQKLEYNTGISNQLKDNPEVVDRLIQIDPEEEAAYRDFVVRKIQTITEIAHIVSIVDYNGQDVSGLSIDEKYKLMADDARIDANLISKLASRQDKMRFGLKPEVSMKNPITGEVVKRPLSFRIPSLIQAMQLSGSDDYDDGYNDED